MTKTKINQHKNNFLYLYNQPYLTKKNEFEILLLKKIHHTQNNR